MNSARNPAIVAGQPHRRSGNDAIASVSAGAGRCVVTVQ